MASFIAALLMGILLLLPEAAPSRWAMVVLCVPPVGWAWYRHQRAGRDRWLPWAGLLLGLICAGWPGPVLSPPPMEAADQFQRLEGVVVEREATPGMVRLTLTEARLPGLDWRAEGKVSLNIWLHGAQTPEEVTALPGDRIRGVAKLREPASHRVPGAFDFSQWMQRQGVVATGSFKGMPEVVETTAAASLNRLREILAADMGRRLSPQQAGAAQAMLLGKRGGLDPVFNEALQASGTYHLIAISGFHLALVAGWSFALVRFILVLVLPLSRRMDVKGLAALGAFPPLVVYAALAGWSVPTQRALLMTALLLLAVVMGRERQALRALGVAAILLLAWQPWQLLQAGFQLSFVAVTLLLIFFSDTAKGLKDRPQPDEEEISPWPRWLRAWGRGARMLFLSSLLLGVALMPITAHHFHRLAPYGLLANLAAIPLTSLVTVPLGFLYLVLDPVFPTLGGWLLAGVGWSLDALRWIAVGTAALPGAQARVPGPPLVGVAWYLAVLALAWMARGRGVRGGLILLALLGWWWPRASMPEGVLHGAVLDVGQGQSVVLRTPGGRWSVVDAGALGGAGRSDPGETLVSAYLWHYGVERLERVVVSHPQADHMAGAARLLRNFPTTTLLVGEFPLEEESDEAYRAILEEAGRRGTAVWRARGGSFEEDGVMFHLHAASLEEAGKNLNNRSLVMALDWGKHRFFLPSDLERAGERRLLRQVALGAVTLLVAPHHGSRSSSSPELVAATRPGHVVFSVGRGNRFGFPKAEVVERWAGSGARLWRTDRDGTVVWESDGEGVRVFSAPWPGIIPILNQ